MKKINMALAIVAIAVIIGGSLLYFYYVMKPKPEALFIKLGYQRYVTHVGLWIALEKGYFEQEGLKVEAEELAPGVPEIVLAYKYDAWGAGIGASDVNAILKGMPAKIVLDKGQAVATTKVTAILASKALYDAGKLTKISDLKGKKIGIDNYGAAFHQMLWAALKSVGLTLDDVEIVLVKEGQGPAMLAAGTIDAHCDTEPHVTAAVDAGAGVVLGWFGEWIPRRQVGVIYFTESLLKNRAAGVAFCKAYLRAIKYLHNAQGGGANRDEVIDIMVKYTLYDKSTIAKLLDIVLIPDDCRITTEGMNTLLGFLWDIEYIEKKVSVEDLVDLSYLEEALKQLG